MARFIVVLEFEDGDVFVGRNNKEVKEEIGKYIMGMLNLNSDGEKVISISVQDTVPLPKQEPAGKPFSLLNRNIQ